MEPDTEAACKPKRHIRELLLGDVNNLPDSVSGSFARFLGKIPPPNPEYLFCTDPGGLITGWFTGDSLVYYAANRDLTGLHILDVLPATATSPLSEAFASAMHTGQISTFEFQLMIDSEPHWHSASCIQINPESMVVVIRDITEQKRITNLANQQYTFMASLQEIARQFSGEADSRAIGRHIVFTCVEKIGATAAWLGWVGPGREVQELAFRKAEDAPASLSRSILPTRDELSSLLKTHSHLIISHMPTEEDESSTRAFFPLVSHDRVFGILGLAVDRPEFFSAECVNFFETYELLAGSIIQNARLYEDSQRQLKQLQTLQRIDQAILSNMDFKSTMSVILNEVAKHIQVDSLALLVLDPATQMLDFLDGYGFRFDTFKHSHLKVGAGYAGQVVLEKRVVRVNNLRENPQGFSRSTKFRDEEFSMYLGTPLIVRGEVKGVLEIFQRAPFEPDAAWLTLLETLSSQIAIAIDNAQLLKFLQDSNDELTTAYNTTIDGLSRALELRDRETQGHTRRVTEMTISLAKKMGVPDEEIIQIRQGALLHDIGKMGIPDAILLKPGALTEDEWETMRKHPMYAYELLSQVEHLKKGIDIPLYHHEKWSGGGYPYGLKGDQIPFAARMFAFADVYDALTSDRPYRPAWDKDKTLAYIRSQTGIQFDPSILPVFEELVC